MGLDSMVYSVIRAGIFAVICAVLFTVLSILTSYQIQDVSLKATIMEERLLNTFEANQKSLLTANENDINSIVSRLDMKGKDRIGFRIRFYDPDTGTEFTQKRIIFDPTGLVATRLPSTGQVKSNFKSYVTQRYYIEPLTKKIYRLQFEFISAAG